MNIDLLLTAQGALGLISDTLFSSPVAGVLFDVETHLVTLEYDNMETIDLNIPVEDDLTDTMLLTTAIQIGVVTEDKVQDSRTVPLMLLNDRDGLPHQNQPHRPSYSVTAFEAFMKACVAGQPLHRDDLGDERGSGSVVGGLNRTILQFAPHLARQRTLEASNTLDMAGPAPAAPGPAGMGGGRATPPARRTSSSPPDRKRPPPDAAETEDEA